MMIIFNVTFVLFIALGRVTAVNCVPRTARVAGILAKKIITRVNWLGCVPSKKGRRIVVLN